MVWTVWGSNPRHDD